VSSESSPPREKEDRERSRLERIVPDLVKKFVEAGVEKLGDGPESLKHLLSDLKLPKESIAVITSQLDDARREITTALAREVRDFLERASLAEEMTKLLSGLTLEIKTQVRFVPSEDGKLRPKPEVRTKLGIQSDSANRTDVSDGGSIPPSASRSSTIPPTPIEPQKTVSTAPPVDQERTK
jgi:hypothetical protein